MQGWTGEEDLFSEYSKFVGSWKDRNSQGENLICSGMRKNNKKHGVVRVVRPGKYIIEGTFKNGLAHGLQICYNLSEVTYSRYEEGVLMSDNIKIENLAEPAQDLEKRFGQKTFDTSIEVA